jgi:hypothetical protein
VALANSTFGSLFASGTANIARAYQQQAVRQQALAQSDLQKALAQMSGIGVVTQGAPAPDTQRAKAHQPESNLAWLNRRVDEVRVRL